MAYLTDFEISCMEKALRPLGEHLTKVGVQKTFNDLSRAEVMKIIALIVLTYREEMSKGSEEIPFWCWILIIDLLCLKLSLD